MNRFDSALLSQISTYLLEPEYELPRFHRTAFPVEPGDTLTASVSNLNETGQVLATRALLAWTEATGIHFRLVESDDVDINFSDDHFRTNAIGEKQGRCHHIGHRLHPGARL